MTEAIETGGCAPPVVIDEPKPVTRGNKAHPSFVGKADLREQLKAATAEIASLNEHLRRVYLLTWTACGVAFGLIVALVAVLR